MKKFAIVLIAVTIFSIQWHHAKAQEIELNKQQNESTVTLEQTRTTPEPAVEAKKEKQWHELTVEEKIKLNPNKCDLAKQQMWASDGSCHDKTTMSTSRTQNASHASSGVVTGGSCEAEIAKYDWPQNLARAVMLAESSGNPTIVNNNPATRDYSVGCFQINLYGANARTRPSEAWLKNAANNVSYAYGIYKANGSSFAGQWGAYNSGKYLKYMR